MQCNILTFKGKTYVNKRAPFLSFFRVLKPPGGMSSPIFSETDSTTSSNESRASSTSPKTPQKVYRMASNFELGDEQPENPPARRKPFKPSGTMIRRKISVQWLPKGMRFLGSDFQSCLILALPNFSKLRLYRF